MGPVAGGELLGWLSGALVSLLTEIFAKPKRAFDQVLGKKFIQPHLAWFTKTFRAFTPELRKGEEAAEKMTDEERSAYIAGGMTNVLYSSAVGIAASFGGQRLLGGKDNSLSKGATWCSGIADATFHVGAMYVQPTLLAQNSEDVKNRISSILQKSLKFGKSYADSLAFSTVYYMGPEVAGMFGRFGGGMVGQHYFPS